MTFAKQQPLNLTLSALAVAIGIAHSNYTLAAPVAGTNNNFANTVGNTTTVDITNEGNYNTLNWASFDLLSNETVIFNQASTNTVTLNNIADSSPSEILGTIEANGHIILQNNNGFIFGDGAVIDTKGFLATSLSASLLSDTSNLVLSGTGNNASIQIGNLSTGSENQILAFYSPNISTSGQVSAQNDVYFSSGAHTSDTITLPGLPIGFDASGITTTANNQNINLAGSTIATATTDATVYINQTDLSNLLSGSVKLPSSLTADSLKLTSQSDINIGEDSSDTNSINSSNYNVSHFSIEAVNQGSTINVNKFIYANNPNQTLHLSANTIHIGENGGSSFLGANAQISNAVLIADNVNASSGIIMGNSLTVESNLNITANGDVRLDAPNSLNITGALNYIKADLNDPSAQSMLILSKNLTLGQGIPGQTSTSIADTIEIYSDNINTAGILKADNNISLNAYTNNSVPVTLTLLGDLTLLANNIAFDSDRSFTLTSTQDETYHFNVGSKDIGGVKANSVNLATLNASGLSEFGVYLDAPSSSLLMGGDISANTITLTHNGNSAFSTLSLNDNLSLTVESGGLDAAKINFNSSVYSVALNSGDSTATAQLGQANELLGFSAKNFAALSFSGNTLNTGSSGVDIANTVGQVILAQNFAIESSSGDISIGADIQSSNGNMTVSTSTGSLDLAQLSVANGSLTLSTSSLGGSSHTLSGDIQASGNITMENLDSVNFSNDANDNSASAFTIQSSNGDINLVGTELVNQDTPIEVHAGGSLALGFMNAKDINITASNLTLNDNLIAVGDLNIQHSDINGALNIELAEDVTLQGNINLLDNKAFNGNTLYYLDALGALSATPVPTINGSQSLTFIASNEEAYLFNMGASTPLASFTLDSINDNHSGEVFMVSQPVIGSTLGLSILGNWDWNEDSDLHIDTNNTNLNLSGVNLNVEGKITLDTGNGDLSLGNIGTTGLTKDLEIVEANTLSLHGELILTEAESGYSFNNVSAIRLYTDLELGSADAFVNVNFGDATIDGTYDLTLYSDDVTLGTIGSNIALQDFTLVSTKDITLNNDISLVGNANIQANTLTVNGHIHSTGLDITLNAQGDLVLHANSALSADFGNINLISETGNIALSELTARNQIYVESKAGYISNAIGDYISNDSTSVNASATSLTLLGKARVGDSVANPIVIDMQNGGTIKTESDGNIYIANLADAPVNSQSRVFDTTSSSDLAIIDAYTQLQLSSLNAYIEPSYQSTLGLIGHINWQVDEDKTIQNIKRPQSTPNLYYSRQGWRLGY